MLDEARQGKCVFTLPARDAVSFKVLLKRNGYAIKSKCKYGMTTVTIVSK